MRKEKQRIIVFIAGLFSENFKGMAGSHLNSSGYKIIEEGFIKSRKDAGNC